MENVYESPFSGRYSSEEMLRLFSKRTRHETWRKLWVELARAERELGLPIRQEQVDELAAHVGDIDYAVVEAKEREIRHDVMAHIYAYGLVCPNAAGILHLGATSCYVTDNADLVLYRDALRLIRAELIPVLRNLRDFARRYRALPTLGYTHLQPAQLVTVGKRACLWIQDLWMDLEELDGVSGRLRFLGCRGTTGTEASFVELFNGDTTKIDRMNRMIADAFGFEKLFAVSGQTYPRKLDAQVLNCLSAIATSCYRFANDLRLLQHMRQIEEPSESAQVGSSAMAYKRNPMRSERICSLARYAMTNALNGPATASVQWFERTLDDSAIRRISLPEGFLCVDAILRLMKNVTGGLRVYPKVIAKAVGEWLPFIATENLLMASVKKGGNRQESHEIIREHSLSVADAAKNGETLDLLRLLAEDDRFNLSAAEIEAALRPEDFVGRSAEQVDQFLDSLPLPDSDVETGEISV